MSRTVRRSYYKQKTLAGFICRRNRFYSLRYALGSSDYEIHVAESVADWNSRCRDGKGNETTLNRLIKEATKEKVRVAARREIHHAMKMVDLEDFIDSPHEWNTRGERWNWD